MTMPSTSIGQVSGIAPGRARRVQTEAGARPARPRSAPLTPRLEPPRPPPAADPPNATLPARSPAGPALPTPIRSVLPTPGGAARALPARARWAPGPRRPPPRSARPRPPARARAPRHRCGASVPARCRPAPPPRRRAPPSRAERCAGAKTTDRCATRAGPPAPLSPAAWSCRRLRLGRRGRLRVRTRFAQLALQVVGHGAVAAQRLGRLLASRPHALAPGLEPRAAFLDQPTLDAEVEQVVRPGEADAVEDVELRFAEGRSQLVLHHFRPRAVADHLVAVLDGADAADVQAEAGVELERVSAGRGLGRAEYHADLHPDLVDEDHRGAVAAHHRGQLAERLGHQPRLQTHVSVAHLSLDLGLRDQRRDRVDHHQFHGPGPHQGLRNLQGLLARVGLRDQEVFDLDAELARVRDVERVLGVDERRAPALRLHLRDGVERQRRLPGAFRPEDLHDAPPRIPAASNRKVEPQRPAGDGRHELSDLALAEPHHRAFAELLFDGAHRREDGLQLLRHLAHVPSLRIAPGDAPGARFSAALRANWSDVSRPVPGPPRTGRSRHRSCTAPFTSFSSTRSRASRSAMVRASFRIRSWARAERFFSSMNLASRARAASLASTSFRSAGPVSCAL